MLTTYRRHVKACAHRSEGRKYRRCRCPIWADGLLGREEIRKSLETRDWEKAQGIIRGWEAEGRKPPEPAETRMTLEAAFDQFVADSESRQLGPDAIYRRKLMRRQMTAFAGDRGLRYLGEVDLKVLRDFRATWKNRNLSAKRKLEQLRAFFKFCVTGGALERNPAEGLDVPIVRQPPTLPFERNEMARILYACDHLYIDNYRRVGQPNARRVKAMVLLLRYGGLRIGDAATLAVSRIRDGALFLRTAKTGTYVTCPLPPIVLEALENCPRANPLYFFWTGQCSRGTVARDWQSKLAKLFNIAGIQNGHPHRFRDTFAIEQLLSGTPIDQVSALLGHCSIKVTERHYAPWVKARQEQMEANVIRSWQKDPLIVVQRRQVELKVGEQQMVN
jgi:integrase/recombinase XerD